MSKMPLSSPVSGLEDKGVGVDSSAERGFDMNDDADDSGDSLKGAGMPVLGCPRICGSVLDWISTLLPEPDVKLLIGTLKLSLLLPSVAPLLLLLPRLRPRGPLSRAVASFAFQTRGWVSLGMPDMMACVVSSDRGRIGRWLLWRRIP